MFIDIIKSIVIGFVEGITEFLPISSTGHIILINQWLTFDESFTALFDIFIQLGAILAVIIYFWHKIWPFNKDEIGKSEIIKMWNKVIIAVIPVLIVGGLFGSIIQKTLFYPKVVAVTLIIGGFILLYVEKKPRTQRFFTISDITWKTALLIGLVQCISMIPGTSRSAATIIGGLFQGASRVVAVEFSFFLAIPTMIAASAYSILKHGLFINSHELIILIVGFATAFLVALIVIKYFIKYIQSHNFIPFAYYRIVLGIAILIYFWN